MILEPVFALYHPDHQNLLGWDNVAWNQIDYRRGVTPDDFRLRVRESGEPAWHVADQEIATRIARMECRMERNTVYQIPHNPFYRDGLIVVRIDMTFIY